MHSKRKFSISVFGLGYVGAVTAACLCKAGHNVIGVDISDSKVDDMKRGISPIFEKGLDELLDEGVKRGNLDATTDAMDATMKTEVSIICVGTPSLDSGRLDLRFVRKVCLELDAALKQKDDKHLLILRSTMLPGSTRSIVADIFRELIDAGQLEVAYCPEFLREGSAIFDYNHPALAVLGSDTGEKIQIAEDLMGVCQWFAWEGAEMIKYGCNFWHAVKVGFANEIGRLCKHVNVDAGRLMATLVTDEKLNISSYYMRPGNPFGGSCLPKDVAALSSFSRQSGINLPLLDSLLSTNQSHLDSLVRIVSRTEVKSVMILGLTFKDNTDDLRGSPMVALAETLLGRGFTVRVHDPKLDAVRLKGSNQEQISRRMPHLAAIMVRDIAEGLRDCRVVVVAHKNVSIDVLAQLVTPEHHVIDVNGWAELNELPCAVEGLCW